MDSLGDTIVAPITGLARAAVAVLRVSGPDAWRVGSEVFGNWPDPVVPRFATYGRFVTGDDGFVLPFEEGRSFTGEQSVEFSIHGSQASVKALVESSSQAGCRQAEPGEFTYRAFMNGRLDLSQAEGVRDTVDAMTELQLRRANQLRGGKLREEAESLRSMVLGVLAAVEASTDFSEEVGEVDTPPNVAVLEEVARGLRRLIDSAEASRIVKEGIRVAIVGPPNVGKSSLLNQVLGSDRAIVSAVPGTTRDTVEEAVEFQGFALHLTDTAGIRETSDEVEVLGIDRSRSAAENADVVWNIHDLSTGESFRLTGAHVIQVGNKSDLAVRGLGPGPKVSAKTGQGINGLLQETVRIALPVPVDSAMVAARHVRPLESALAAVVEAGQTLGSDLPSDLAAVHLRSALRFLGEITGDTATSDIIDRVFQDFCIGK